MKRLVIFIFIFHSSVFVIAQNCNDIKTGTFRIAPDSVTAVESILTRTNDVQIEDIKERGVKMQFNIKWTSECSYTLSKPKVLKGEVPGVSDKHELYVKITKVTSSYYTAELTSNFSDMKLIKDIEIIKE